MADLAVGEGERRVANSKSTRDSEDNSTFEKAHTYAQVQETPRSRFICYMGDSMFDSMLGIYATFGIDSKYCSDLAIWGELEMLEGREHFNIYEGMRAGITATQIHRLHGKAVDLSQCWASMPYLV